MNERQITQTVISNGDSENRIELTLVNGEITKMHIRTIDAIDHGVNIYLDGRRGNLKELLNLFSELNNHLENK